MNRNRQQSDSYTAATGDFACDFARGHPKAPYSTQLGVFW
jgi:hypothetical protein